MLVHRRAAVRRRGAAGRVHRARRDGLVGVGHAATREPPSARVTAALLGTRAVVATLILVPILRAAHGAAPVGRATTSMSLGAQLLPNLKRLETWYVWIAVDVIYVPLYFIAVDLNLTALVYVVFLALCVQGWRSGARHGLVLGKFLPPHAGHHELVDFALAQCERVTVLVLRRGRERHRRRPLRREWRRTRARAGDRARARSRTRRRSRWRCGASGCASAHPAPAWSRLGRDSRSTSTIRTSTTSHRADGALLQRARSTPFHGRGLRRPAGRALGRRARLPAARGVISGTQVRADPAACVGTDAAGARVPLPARGDPGAESTGTTTLAAPRRALGTSWVPRARATEARGILGADRRGFERRRASSATRTAPRCVRPGAVCDTDALATCIWQERYRGRSTAAVEPIAVASTRATATTSRSCRTASATASTCAAG